MSLRHIFEAKYILKMIAYSFAAGYILETAAKKRGLAKNQVINKNPQFKTNYYETW